MTPRKCRNAAFPGEAGTQQLRYISAPDLIGPRSQQFRFLGVYGVPLQSAAKIAVTTVKNNIDGSGVDVVKFGCFDDKTLSTYEQLLSDSGTAKEP
jgi:hypothetical protein